MVTWRIQPGDVACLREDAILWPTSRCFDRPGALLGWQVAEARRRGLPTIGRGTVCLVLAVQPPSPDQPLSVVLVLGDGAVGWCDRL